MAIGENAHGQMNFHIHMPHVHFHHHQHHHYHHGGGKRVPKGFMAVTVGQGEEQQRFVIPVMYVNHPLFMQLLKEAEEEYGFDQKGPINIPCHVEEFCQVRGLIDKEATTTAPTTTTTFQHHQQHEHDHDQHQHHHHFLCFKA